MSIKKLKLTTLSESILKAKESQALLGGNVMCSCSCYWENNTGSTTYDNINANYDKGTSSVHGCNQYKVMSDENTLYVEYDYTADAHA